MEGDIILNFLSSLNPMARMIIELVGLVASAIVTFITLSPWKGDDAVLDQVKKMPLIGSLLAALMKFSPFVRK